MKRTMTALVLLFPLLLPPAASATGPRKRQAMAHPRTYGSAAYHSSASRPYYGGGRHRTSHGGHYYGATNAHHRGGHYGNWNTRSRYGVHKPR
ncbi:MAG: hypothetical protein WCE63_16830 [Acidobacteriaceae bacterium]